MYSEGLPIHNTIRAEFFSLHFSYCTTCCEMAIFLFFMDSPITFFLIFLFCSENCYHFYGNDGALMEIKGNQDKLMVIDCFTSHQSSMSVDTPNLLNWVSFMYLSEKFCGEAKTYFLITFSCWKGGEMPIPDMISNPCHIPGTVGIPIKVIHFRVHEAQHFTEHNY